MITFIRLAGCLFFFLLAFLFYSCADKTEPPEPTMAERCQLNDRATTYYEHLLTAYEDSCKSCLQALLESWHQNKPPQTIPDSMVQIFNLYEAFFTPWNLRRIIFYRDSVSYEGSEYYMIQPGFSYNTNYNSDITKPDNVIEDFRPPMAVDSIKYIYYDADYEQALSCFLVGEISSRQNFLPADERNRRKLFLENHFRVVGRFNAFLYDYITHPKIGYINFNQALDTAIISYRIEYYGYSALMIRENNNWKLIKYELLWAD